MVDGNRAQVNQYNRSRAINGRDSRMVFSACFSGMRNLMHYREEDVKNVTYRRRVFSFPVRNEKPNE